MGRREHERVTVIGSYPSKKVTLFNQDLAVGDYQLYLDAGKSFDLEVRPESQYEVCQTKQMNISWGMFGDSTADANAKKRFAVITNKRKIGLVIGADFVHKELKYSYGKFNDGATDILPTDTTALYMAQSEGYFDYNDPLIVQFHNLGGTNQRNEPKNKFDPFGVQVGKHLHYQTNVLSDNVDWDTSDYLAVVPGETYLFSIPSYSKSVVWYDNAKNYLSGNNISSVGLADTTLQVPANAVFMRVSYDHRYTTPGNIQIIKNATRIYKNVIIRYESERVV